MTPPEARVVAAARHLVAAYERNGTVLDLDEEQRLIEAVKALDVPQARRWVGDDDP